jgi:hypothetical protein
VESRDAVIIEKLVDQKYSLNNLMIMLSEQKNNEVISSYIHDLSKIQKEFNALKINFGPSFNANSPEGKKLIEVSLHNLESFHSAVNDFRNKLVK